VVSGLLVLSMGCATANRGPMQRIYVESEPSGAAVELIDCARDEQDLRTPVEIFISRRVSRCTILVTMDGYEPARIMLTRRPADYTSADRAEDIEEICGSNLENCNSLGDLLVLGTIGALVWGVGKGVDAMAGSNYQLEPAEVRAELEPVATEHSAAEP
jgi:hypothetical protein